MLQLGRPLTAMLQLPKRLLITFARRNTVQWPPEVPHVLVHMPCSIGEYRTTYSFKTQVTIRRTRIMRSAWMATIRPGTVLAHVAGVNCSKQAKTQKTMAYAGYVQNGSIYPALTRPHAHAGRDSASLAHSLRQYMYSSPSPFMWTPSYQLWCNSYAVTCQVGACHIGSSATAEYNHPMTVSVLSAPHGFTQ